MRRLSLALVALSLFAACKKDAPSAESNEPGTAQDAEALEGRTKNPAAGESGGTEAQAQDDLAQDAPGERAGKLEVTEDVMTRFVAYWERELATMEQVIKEMEKSTQQLESEGEGVGSAIRAVDRTTEISERWEKERRKLIAASGFTEDQIEYLRDLVTDVATPRLLVVKGADQEKLVEQLRKSIAGMPEEARAEAQQQIDEMEKGLEELRNATDARKDYGDTAVDAVIKHEAKLLPLYEKMLKTALAR